MQRFLTILQNYLNQINMPNLRWTDIVEILILTFLIYHILLWIKNTRAWSLLKGLLVIGAFVALAALFNMSTILWIVQHVTGLAVSHRRRDPFTAGAAQCDGRTGADQHPQFFI